jgi:hypothetical protein
MFGTFNFVRLICRFALGKGCSRPERPWPWPAHQSFKFLNFYLEILKGVDIPVANLPLLPKIPAENLPPVSTIPIGTILDCLHLKEDLREKIYLIYMLTLLPKGVQTK